MLTFNFNPGPPQKCKHCNKVRGLHKANTFECPAGMKTRVGYTQYGPTVWTPKKSRKSK